jgi:hypothetical protein
VDEITFGMLLPNLKLSKLQLKNIYDDRELADSADQDIIVHPDLLSELIFADFLLQLYFIDADQRQLITAYAGDIVTKLRGSYGPPKMLVFVDGLYFGTSEVPGLLDIKTGEPLNDPKYIPQESLVYNLEEMFRRKIQTVLMKDPNGKRQADDPTLA